MSVIANFTIFPTDKGESASPFVAKVIQLFDQEGVNYVLNSMSTNIETETMEECLSIINMAYQVLAEDCNRIYIVLTMDIRKGEKGRMISKIQSVNRIIDDEKN